MCVEISFSLHCLKNIFKNNKKGILLAFHLFFLLRCLVTRLVFPIWIICFIMTSQDLTNLLYELFLTSYYIIPHCIPTFISRSCTVEKWGKGLHLYCQPWGLQDVVTNLSRGACQSDTRQNLPCQSQQRSYLKYCLTIQL